LEKIDVATGVGGLLKAFKTAVKDAKKITFVGCPGTCTPFAELLAYAVRDSVEELVYVRNAEYEDARRIVMTENGMQLEDKVDARADTIVLLGGLCTGKSCVNAEGALRLVDTLAIGTPRVIGVCFMSMFQEAGWTDVIDFDVLLDTDLIASTYEK
jgi:hypothetical protein